MDANVDFTSLLYPFRYDGFVTFFFYLLFFFPFLFHLKFQPLLVAYFVYGSLLNLMDSTDFSIIMMMIAISILLPFLLLLLL